MASRRRKIGFRIAALSIGLLFVLGICEILIRSLPKAVIPELYPSPRYQVGTMIQPSENPNLYFELKPNEPSTEVNSEGYRGPLVPMQKPDGVQRIVGIGDSTLFGWMLPHKKTMLPQLAGMFAPDSVEAINLSCPAYDSHQELEVLKTRAMQFEPDLIVLGYDHNDPIPILPAMPLLPDKYGDNFLHSQLLRYLIRKWRSQDLRKSQKLPEGNLDVEGFYYAGPLWDAHLRALEEFMKHAQDAGVPVVVMIYCPHAKPDPDLDSEHHRLFTKPLVDFFHQHGAHVLSSYHLFQDYMQGKGVQDISSLWLKPKIPDVHPSAASHRMIAQALHDLITEKGLLKR
jgi:hypothetical protein